MTEKENCLEIINFGKPDHITGGMSPCQGICYFGMNHENAEGKSHEQPVGSVWTDIWGTVWQKEHEGVMGFPRQNPLDDLAKMDKYPWPDPDDERLIKQIYTMAESCDKDTSFVVGGHRDTLWEKSYMLCGMENMMCNFYTEPEATKELLHRIMDFQLGIAKHYLAAGINAASCGDDLAEVRRITRGRMALQGGLSSGLLVDGPPEKIRMKVKRLINLLGKEGGYFCACDQGMPWPQEHYDAYLQALEEYGKYPLPETQVS